MAELTGGCPDIGAVVFDVGATLVTGPEVAPNKVIAELYGGVNAAEVASVIMTDEFRSAEEACAIIEDRFGTFSDCARTAFFDLWLSQSEAAREIPGASETVLELKRRGLKIGLLSDIWSPYYASVEKAIPRVVEAADAIVLSCRTGARKPGLKNFARIAEELQIESGRTVMVGDTFEHDIQPAMEMGMRAVWVLARPQRESASIVRVLNGEVTGPCATVRSITEVVALDFWPDTAPVPLTE